MQAAPLPVALPSSSKQPKAGETVIELPTGQMIDTWNDEIFELPFLFRNPESAMAHLLYSSEAVAGHDNPKIRVSMKLMNKKYGVYMRMEQVSCMLHAWEFQSSNAILRKYTHISFNRANLTCHTSATSLLGHLDACHIPLHAARGHAGAGGNIGDVREEYAGEWSDC